MGKTWDGWDTPGSYQRWCYAWAQELFRVLKPGGHLLAFGGTRTYHRIVCAIEDAGFECRDTIQWIHGQGFPKSLDVGKAIDKRRDDRGDILRVTTWLANARDAAGLMNRDIDETFGFAGMAGHWTTRLSQPAVPTWDQWLRLRDLLGFGDEMDAEVWRLNGRKGTPGEAWEQRGVIGTIRNNQPGGTSAFAQGGIGSYVRGDTRERQVVGAPATAGAQQWDGWGTALKPAHEPIVLARKPLDSTVAGNVTRWGTGALNVDACRVDSGGTHGSAKSAGMGSGKPASGVPFVGGVISAPHPAGRWPADVVLSHNPTCSGVCSPGCAVAELDQQSGTLHSGGGLKHGGVDSSRWRDMEGRTDPQVRAPLTCEPNEGGASRFFPTFRYQAKPSTREKNNGLEHLDGVHNPNGNKWTDVDYRRGDGEVTAPARKNHHPTVKPVELMRWLVRLVTPPGGTVLDPFAGSGSTLVAATLEGFDSVGVEAEAEYLPLIEGRVRWAESQVEQPALSFD